MIAALILAAACIPSEEWTPTPVIMHDQALTITGNPSVAGYTYYIRSDGGPFEKVVDIPCQLDDWDGDGVGETCFWRGIELGIPLQRYCPSSKCEPYREYEWAVKAYTETFVESEAFSNPVPVCFPALCEWPGPVGQCDWGTH